MTLLRIENSLTCPYLPFFFFLFIDNHSLTFCKGTTIHLFAFIISKRRRRGVELSLQKKKKVFSHSLPIHYPYNLTRKWVFSTNVCFVKCKRWPNIACKYRFHFFFLFIVVFLCAITTVIARYVSVQWLIHLEQNKKKSNTIPFHSFSM